MATRKIFAQNLRYWRKERGLSQEQLALRAGIDRTYISALERELYSVSIDTLGKLAKVLNIEPAKLLERPPRSGK
ncbi:MAG: helix-turn-helix transcriptional regulator [Rhizomicrobium sp.]|jgi:transcriptional regulator with XRE-family HTH domain